MWEEVLSFCFLLLKILGHHARDLASVSPVFPTIDRTMSIADFALLEPIMGRAGLAVMKAVVCRSDLVICQY